MERESVEQQLQRIEILARRVLSTRYWNLDAINDDAQTLNNAVQALCAAPVFAEQVASSDAQGNLPALAQSIKAVIDLTTVAMHHATAEVRRLDSIPEPRYIN